MKNVILGIIGCYLIVYMVVITISLYGVTIRKNELYNCVSDVMKQQVEYFLENHDRMGDRANQYLKSAIEQEIRTRLQEDSKLEISFPSCDLSKGIVSIKISEQYPLPGKKYKEIQFLKTLIVSYALG